MKQKELLIILASLFLLTFLWVIFNIYHNYVTSTIKSPLDIQIIPIEGKFDRSTIAKIRERQRVDPLYEAQVQNEINPADSTFTPELTESASSSAEEINIDQIVQDDTLDLTDQEAGVNLNQDQTETIPNEEP